MSSLVKLYPATWRRRYEQEFSQLLAERPPSVRDRIDIVRGALDARVSPQIPGSRVRERVGYLALLGMGVWIAALIVMMNGPVMRDSYGTYRDGAAALPLFVLAFVLLAATLVAIVRRLPERPGRAAGLVAVVAGPIWSAMPWLLPVGLVFLLGLIAAAVSATRAGLWSRWSLAALLATVAAPVLLFAIAPLLPWYALREAEPGLVFSVLLSLSGIWLVVGATLLHGHARPAPVA